MIVVNIEIDENALKFYNLTEEEKEILMNNLKPAKDSFESQIQSYLEDCLQDLKELKEECKK